MIPDPSNVPTVILVPGLRAEVEEHWQTHLERTCPGTRTSAPSAGASRTCRAGRRPPGGGLCGSRPGAARRPQRRLPGDPALGSPVRGRAGRRRTPGDPARPGEELPAAYPSLAELGAAGWLPVPTDPLPFPSIVAVSDDDPLGDAVGSARSPGSGAARSPRSARWVTSTPRRATANGRPREALAEPPR